MTAAKRADAVIDLVRRYQDRMVTAGEEPITRLQIVFVEPLHLPAAITMQRELLNRARRAGSGKGYRFALVDAADLDLARAAWEGREHPLAGELGPSEARTACFLREVL